MLGALTRPRSPGMGLLGVAQQAQGFDGRRADECITDGPAGVALLAPDHADRDGRSFRVSFENPKAEDGARSNRPGSLQKETAYRPALIEALVAGSLEPHARHNHA